MPFLIGTDEAGYAPNLGPLVVSATVWHLADGDPAACLYARLKKVVSRTAKTRAGQRPNLRRVAIADSKELYSPAQGLSLLERGVLAALALVDRVPGDWSDLWQMLDAETLPRLASLPWHLNYDLRLPLAADVEDLGQLLPVLRRGFERAGVRLVAICSRAVFPREFNDSNQTLGNKSETLSQVTLELVAQALVHCPDEPITVVCDKHGGRNNYQRHLQQRFPDPLVTVLREGLQESSYRFCEEGRTVDVHFRARGESFMPTALASMTSKYLRELSMRAFNDFWCGIVPELAPTAGYPGDARRFYDAIRPAQQKLGIADGLLWRDR